MLGSSYLRLQRGRAGAALVCLAAACAIAQSVTDREGRPANPIADNHGKPVVLIFVRTDCPISNRYAPTIQKLAAAYAAKAKFWLVYPNKADTGTAIAAHVAEYGYGFPWLRDPDHVRVAQAKATITPEAALFDAQGKLRYHGRIDNLYMSPGRTRRAPTKNDLGDALTAVLAGKSVNVDASPAIGCYIADVK